MEKRKQLVGKDLIAIIEKFKLEDVPISKNHNQIRFEFPAKETDLVDPFGEKMKKYTDLVIDLDTGETFRSLWLRGDIGNVIERMFQ